MEADPAAPVAGPRSRLVRAARVAYLVVLAAVLAWLVARRREHLGDLVHGTRPAWLVVALGLTFVQLLVNGQFWSAALRALDEPLPYPVVLSSGVRSLPARYLPGSVWYVLGRSALLVRAGASKRALGVVAVLEAGLSVVVGVSLGIGLLLASGSHTANGAVLGAWCAVLVVGCSPPVVNRVLAFVASRRGGIVRRLDWPEFAALVGWMAVFWVNSALGFLAYLHAFPGVHLESWAEVAGSFMVAWVIGFLAIFAPQGLGVFEAAVASLLVDRDVAAVAVIVAGFRALVLVRDVTAVLVAEAAARRATTRN